LLFRFSSLALTRNPSHVASDADGQDGPSVHEPDVQESKAHHRRTSQRSAIASSRRSAGAHNQWSFPSFFFSFLQSLEKYFVGSRLQLQERLATILAMNTDSLVLTPCTRHHLFSSVVRSSPNAGVTHRTAQISAPIPRLNVQTTHPHYITLRFAEFSATRCVIFDGVEAEWWQMGGVAEACAGLRRAMGDLLVRALPLREEEDEDANNWLIFLCRRGWPPFTARRRIRPCS
jgi:hypothetical protein